MHVLVFVHAFDPLVGLALWIDDQRPPSAVENENTVVRRQSVCG